MSINATQVAIIAGITAVVGAVVQAIFNHIETPKQIGNGTAPESVTGSFWTNAGDNDSLQMTPQKGVYQNAPGRQHNRSFFNGSIYTQRFHKGGNPNSAVNYEQSYAIQSATKNPFANGPNNYYARAVNNATQDPTNQATSLVLGPGIAPNDGN